MYTMYLLPEDTFGDGERSGNRVGAATVHRRGLGSLLDPVPQSLGVGRGPRAESKRVFDAWQDRFCSMHSLVQSRVDRRCSSLAGMAVSYEFFVNCWLRPDRGPFFAGGRDAGTLTTISMS